MRSETHSLTSHPQRLLRPAALAWLIRGYRLPRYNAIANWIIDYEALQSVTNLWRELWHESPPSDVSGYAWDIFEALVARVNEELFPVDLTFHWEYISSSGEVWDVKDAVRGPIWHRCYGVNWEEDGLDNLLFDSARPLVAAVATVAALEFDWDDMWRNGAYAEELRVFWQRHGYDTMPRLTWTLDELFAEAYLSQLQPPLDGLAMAYQMVVKETENPFLKTDQEAYFEIRDWSGDNVRALLRWWQQIAAGVEQWQAYNRWYDAGMLAAEREAQVVKLLVEAEDYYDGDGWL